MALAQPTQPLCTVPFVEVSVAGELDLACLPEAGAFFDTILSLQAERVVVDLVDCQRLDAAAVGLLLDVHRQLAARRALLTLRGPGPGIRRIIRSAGLDQVFHTVAADAGEPVPAIAADQDRQAVPGTADGRPPAAAGTVVPGNVARGRAQVISPSIP